MSKTVGYFEGTDPALLNKLVAHGIGTMPVSNGFDSHGKQIGYLTKNDGIDLVVGYFYKVVPPKEIGLTMKKIVLSCALNKIPVLLITDEAIHKAAAKLMGRMPKGVKMVPAAKISDEVFAALKIKSKTLPAKKAAKKPARKATKAKGKKKR